MVPVIVGSDVEVSNFIRNAAWPGSTSAQAARMLLAEIAGFPRVQLGYEWSYDSPRFADDDEPDSYGWKGTKDGYNPRDSGRKWLSSGACCYIDLDHLETCLAELRSAKAFVAGWHAAMRFVEQARQAAAGRLPTGQKLVVLFNNSDGQGEQGHSFGSHLNFLIPRRTWDDIFCHKSLFLPFLATFQVTSMIITGQGKVGAENGRPAVDYQISQRADYLETLRGEQTTYQRPIVNARDEALCGSTGSFRDASPSAMLARLHVISYDSNLCHVACLLKVGMMQIILAMLQRGRVRTNLVLEDPVAATAQISHDPDLNARAPTISGQHLTALELQFGFLEEARRFVDSGACNATVPGADEIVSIWADTLDKLQRRDFDALKSRLDWVLKKTLIEQAMARRPEMTWTSPQARLLDQLYSSSDHAEGLYWACEREGTIERVVAPVEIERAMHEPPEGTRAWTRGKLLQIAGDTVDHVNWDVIRLRTSGNGYSGKYWTLDLNDPTSFTKAQTKAIFDRSNSLEDLLERLCRLNRADTSDV